MPNPPAHVRLTMLANLPAGELASMNVSLKPVLNNFPDPAPEDAIHMNPRLPFVDSWVERLKTACVAFYGRGTSGFADSTALVRVKVASIDANGHYSSAPVEWAVNQAGGVGGTLFPNQIAHKVTLHTDGDLGRVKGGFYLCARTTTEWDSAAQLLGGVTWDLRKDSIGEFLEDLEDESVVDGFRWRVVVASSGRHNPDGTVRRPPTLHDVTGFTLGRRLDVQRRRANKISEARGAARAI